jgi:DNA-binding response OmpR family regulator
MADDITNNPQKSLQPASTISTRPRAETAASAMQRILVIEDGSALRRALKRLFESEGYDVDLAATGVSGLELFGMMMPSLVLLDLGLPDISGQEVYRTIIQVAPGLPIIVISAKTDIAERAALLEMGAYDYLTKPFSPKELLERVRAALQEQSGVSLLPTGT